MSKKSLNPFKGYRFTLIPFIIALVIFIAIPVGTAHYTLFLDTNIQEAYIYDEIESLNSVTTLASDLERIEQYINYTSTYYAFIDDAVTYYDPKKAKTSSIEAATITSSPTKTGANFTYEGSTYENGVLHVGSGDDHLFDLALFAQCTNISNANAFNYYFVIYNVNYAKVDMSTLDICFVNDYQLVEGEEYVIGDEKLTKVLNEYRYKYYDEEYGFLTNGTTNISVTAFDKVFDLLDINGSDSSAYIYEFMTFSSSYVYAGDIDSDETRYISLSELEKATFSIIADVNQNSATKIVDFTEVVRGEFTNPYTDADNFIASYGTDERIKKGYSDKIVSGLTNYNFKTKAYRSYASKYVVRNSLIAGAIALVISFLFYTIWQDDSKIEFKKKKRS